MAGARSSEHALRSAPVRATARGAHRPNPFGSGPKRAKTPLNRVPYHLRRRVQNFAFGLREKQITFYEQNAEQGCGVDLQVHMFRNLPQLLTY